MIDISIILPVFNSEKSIVKVIECVLKQTFKNWELLIVDDGSNDSTGKICDEYSQCDARIKVFHKFNEGVASARQIGIEKAKGTYSIHIDSDDWFEHDMLQVMYDEINRVGADVLIVDFYKCFPNGNNIRIAQNISDLSSVEVLYGILNGRYFGSLWNKMIRHELYRNCNACFYKGINYMEDVLVWIQILQNTSLKVSYLPKAYYHYVLNQHSITNTISRKTFEGIVNMHSKIKVLLPNIDKRFVIYKETLCIGEFQAGFLNGIFTDSEIREYFLKMKHLAYRNPSIRWKIGYFLVQIGAYRLARILLNC